MSGEIVKLKGSKQGLQLVFAPGAEFDAIKADIRNKLEEGSRFFRRGTVIQIAPGTLSAENEAALRKLFHQHGVLFRGGEEGTIRKNLVEQPRNLVTLRFLGSQVPS